MEDLLAGRLARVTVDEPANLTDLVYFKGAFFAGTWAEVPNEAGPGIFASTDGLSWSAVEGLSWPGEARPYVEVGLTASSSRLLAWTQDGAVWVTDDGRDWRLVSGQAFPAAADEVPAVSDMVAVEGGFAAAGGRWPEGELCVGACFRRGLWLSEDGETWQLVTTSRRLARSLSAVAAGPDYLLALGSWDEGVPPHDAWFSEDGRSWIPAPDVFPRVDELARGIETLVGGSRVFALASAVVDYEYIESIGLWEWTDQGWIERTTDELVAPPGYDRAHWTAMVATPDGYVIVGDARRTRDGGQAALAWVSPDAVEWTLVELPDGMGASAVATSPDRIVIAGGHAGERVFWVTEANR